MYETHLYADRNIWEDAEVNLATFYDFQLLHNDLLRRR